MRINSLLGVMLAIFIIGILSGCKNLTPVEASRSAADDTRMLISGNVSDEVRAKKLIEIVNKLEKELETYNEKQVAHNKIIVAKNANFDASSNEMKALYDAFNEDTLTMYRLIAETHMKMKTLATEEEWAFISRPKNRIGGY